MSTLLNIYRYSCSKLVDLYVCYIKTECATPPPPPHLLPFIILLEIYKRDFHDPGDGVVRFLSVTFFWYFLKALFISLPYYAMLCS